MSLICVQASIFQFHNNFLIALQFLKIWNGKSFALKVHLISLVLIRTIDLQFFACIVIIVILETMMFCFIGIDVFL